MTDKDVTAALLSWAQACFDSILYELKDILRMYRDKLEDMTSADAGAAVETARQLARTVEYKHEQLLKLAAHCDAYDACRCVLNSRGKKKKKKTDDG